MKTTQESSANTQMVYERLKKAEIAEVITYVDFEKCIGQPLKRGMLTWARKTALRENQMVFGTVWKVGLQRLDDLQIIMNAGASFKHIQKASIREKDKISSVAFEKLDIPMKIKHSATAAALAMIHAAASQRTILELEDRAKEREQKLSMMQAIDAFREAESKNSDET